MNATNNANLGCIQVGNVANALAKVNWLKDATANYSTSCQSLSVNNETLLKDIAIYPNPVQSVLNITKSNGLIIRAIEIYSVVGKRILKTTTQAIDTNHLAAGMYVLKIITDNGMAASRFVKE